MTNYTELIVAYETDVRFPDVSGLEHLDMLLTRSELAQHEPFLTTEQRTKLAEADKILLQQAHQFYQSIQQIADLETWRREENVSPLHWWWYLDVISQLPRITVEELSPQEVSN